jgi:CBS domain-containing protein
VLIREVMTESVVTAAPERTVREIAELMRERNVGSVVLVRPRRRMPPRCGQPHP